MGKGSVCLIGAVYPGNEIPMDKGRIPRGLFLNFVNFFIHCNFRASAYATCVISSLCPFVLSQGVYVYIVRDSLLIFIGFVWCFAFWPQKQTIFWNSITL